MNHFDSACFARLAKWIGEEVDEKSGWLIKGSAMDFPDYRERSGYLKALNDVREQLTSIESDLNQGK